MPISMAGSRTQITFKSFRLSTNYDSALIHDPPILSRLVEALVAQMRIERIYRVYETLILPLDDRASREVFFSFLYIYYTIILKQSQILFHSSSEYFFISDFLEGSFSAMHHFLIALSVTLYIFPITVNGKVRINFFNSSLFGRSAFL